jgi:hypothetical protein
VLFASVAAGTTVAPMNVATLSDHAAQVFIGTVVSSAAYWTGSPLRIESEVRFIDVVYLKGEPPSTADAEPALIVPGGAVGSTEFRVAGAPIFVPGQRWLLFLLPTYRTFPIVGLWEGAFQVKPDEEGIPRVLQARAARFSVSTPKGLYAMSPNQP